MVISSERPGLLADGTPINTVQYSATRTAKHARLSLPGICRDACRGRDAHAALPESTASAASPDSLQATPGPGPWGRGDPRAHGLAGTVDLPTPGAITRRLPPFTAVDAGAPGPAGAPGLPSGTTPGPGPVGQPSAASPAQAGGPKQAKAGLGSPVVRLYLLLRQAFGCHLSVDRQCP